jgi:hypothetical protein
MSLPPCLLQAAADRDRDRDRNGQRAASEVSALRRQDGGGARSLESEQRRRLDQRNLRSVRRAVAGALPCVLGFLAGVTVLHKKRIGPSVRWVRKNNRFLKRLQIVILWVFHLIHSSKYTTCGSGVRGKMDPI